MEPSLVLQFRPFADSLVAWTLFAIVFLGGGCTGQITGPASSRDGGAGAGDLRAADAGAEAADGGPPLEVGPDPDQVAAVCGRWLSDRADLREGTWTGDVASCNPGSYQAPGRENTTRLVNLYRWLSGLPPVVHTTELDQAAQECALLQRANNALSHMPPADWDCYTSEGAQAASRSNISSGPAVRSVDAYMADFFAPDTLGHRRWILSGALHEIGIGSTDQHSCMWVISGFGGGGGPDWTAFPPPGVFPAGAVQPYLHSLDASGWSIQSSSMDLSGAEVTVTADGEAAAVEVKPLRAGYGSSQAIAMVPQGWSTEAGVSYHVSVSGVAEPIEYDVHVVDCGSL